MRQFFFILTISILSHQAFTQDYFHKKENLGKNHLIIVHPTLSNMERYQFLVENELLDPGKNKIVGVYSEDENYNYSDVISRYPSVGFHMIPKGLDPEEVFSKNILSSEFFLIFNNSKGIIFNGGPDIPPAVYNEETLTLTNITDPYRNYFEISFLYHLVGGNNPEFEPFLMKNPRYMVLGICLGMQSMNVAAGGTLVQDIPNELYDLNSIESILNLEPDAMHRNYYSDLVIFPEIRSYFLHKIELTDGRWLSRKVKKGNPNPSVFSSHHQAIEKLGDNYRVTATSMDGKVIEGIEHVKFPNVVGIQFHPEVNYLYSSEESFRFSPDDEYFSLLSRLIELDSYDFHASFWKAVSKILK